MENAQSPLDSDTEKWMFKLIQDKGALTVQTLNANVVNFLEFKLSVLSNTVLQNLAGYKL